MDELDLSAALSEFVCASELITSVDAIENRSIYNRRYIDPQANPRRQEKTKQPTLRLYHFTRPQSIASIRKKGLNMGDVPVTKSAIPTGEDFNNAVWLTEQGTPEPQAGWIGQTNKAEMRLTVDIEASDMDLWRWRDLAYHLRVESGWYQTLNQSGGGFADKWFVYCNKPIPPSNIIEVKRMPRKRQARPGP